MVINVNGISIEKYLRFIIVAHMDTNNIMICFISELNPDRQLKKKYNNYQFNIPFPQQRHSYHPIYHNTTGHCGILLNKKLSVFPIKIAEGS